MSDPRDLSGVWYGSYAADHYDERNSFIAHLEEVQGLFAGTITEPDDRTGGIRRATVTGQRDGGSLRFLKRYDGSGGLSHTLNYAGRVDGEGTIVSGSWMFESYTGAFTMQREKFAEEALEREIEQEEPLLLR